MDILERLALTRAGCSNAKFPFDQAGGGAAPSTGTEESGGPRVPTLWMANSFGDRSATGSRGISVLESFRVGGSYGDFELGWSPAERGPTARLSSNCPAVDYVVRFEDIESGCAGAEPSRACSNSTAVIQVPCSGIDGVRLEDINS